MINKTFTYKGFSDDKAALDYARAALESGATYIEILKGSPRFKYFESPIVVQHNAKRWIK